MITETGTVLDGGDLIIDNTLLSGVDVDDPNPSDLTLTVTSLPVHGELRLAGQPVNSGDSFSMQSIFENKFSYHHDETDSDSNTISRQTVDLTFSIEVNTTQDVARTPVFF